MAFWKRNKNNKSDLLSRRYSYGEFLILLPCCSEEVQKTLLQELMGAEAPKYIGSVKIPENLNTVSYGLLDDLKETADSADPVADIVKMVTPLTRKEIYNCNVVDVFGIVNMVRQQIERINAMFRGIRVRYSTEEISAGVKELDFGSFGVLDWYARRMSISNQNEVRDVAWIRIYNCMKIDAEQNNYERRLRRQYTTKRR